MYLPIKRPFILTSFCALLAISACSPAPEQDSHAECICNSQSHLIAATLFTQHSSEYKALCYQAYAAAKVQLPRLTANVDKAAVLLDLDETVLDNSPYTAWQIVNDQPYSPATWSGWVALASAEAVPGVSDFLHFADSLGITLFFVSNRDTSHLAATMDNMRSLGLPQVNPERFLLKTHTSDKSERRSTISAMGYEIVMLIGDNLGDFKGAYDKPATNADRDAAAELDKNAFGAQFIVLPNTLYGTWEGAMYQYNRDLNDEQRCKIRKEMLRPAVLSGS